jgi:hypothetical protein
LARFDVALRRHHRCVPGGDAPERKGELFKNLELRERMRDGLFTRPLAVHERTKKFLAGTDHCHSAADRHHYSQYSLESGLFSVLFPLALAARLFIKDPLMLSSRCDSYFIDTNRQIGKKDLEKMW